MKFPYLRSTIVPLSIGCVAGVVVIAGLTAGYYGWQLFVIAGIIGVLIGVPFGIWSVRRMREADALTRPESPTMDPTASARAVDPRRAEPYPPAPDQGRA
jgi:ABC-type proline/glycine betaine transport system permease subunit